MRSTVDVEQLRGVDVGVPLRRGQLNVPEQLLDRAQIGAALQQVRGEGMPERVRADAEARAAGRDVACDEALHAAPREPCAARGDEQRIAAALAFGRDDRRSKHRPIREPGSQRLLGG